MAQQLSEQRKSAYYAGTFLMVLGFLLFLSNFLFIASSRPMDSAGGFMGRALGGMALIALGKLLRTLGARGVAGSGLVLDPEKAREDLEPYSRMAGGMVKDALGEADVKLGVQPVKVMVKCRACGKLNEEDSKFCRECGKTI